jgi:ABC-type sugar transport system ATPase subunit
VLLARWGALEPELFVLNEPTRGIDVKTREAIHRWIEDIVLAGRCVLLVSSDTQELIRLVPQHGNGVSRSREFAYTSQTLDCEAKEVTNARDSGKGQG